MITSQRKTQTRMSQEKSKYQKCIKQRKSLRKQGKIKGTLCDEGFCTAKSKFKKYPSAYANLYAAQVCKGSKPNSLSRRRRSKSSKRSGRRGKKSSNLLNRWQREKWVDVCERDSRGRHPPCGNQSKSGKYPYCRPSKRISPKTPVTASELSSEQKRRMCSRKRKQPKKRMRSLKKKRRSYGRRR